MQPKHEREGFSSAEEYERTRRDWLRRRPKGIGLYTQYSIYKFVEMIKNVWGNLPNDKWYHCYIGCRIAQEYTEEAARYTAWRKEWMDLNDGQPSRFEEADYEATLHCIGQATAWACVNCCWGRFGSPFARSDEQ